MAGALVLIAGVLASSPAPAIGGPQPPAAPASFPADTPAVRLDLDGLKARLAKDTGASPDLSNVDLGGLDLSGFDFKKANLTGAGLANTKLAGANLFACDLTDA